MIFSQRYQVSAEYGENGNEYFISEMITFDNHVICNVNNTDIDKIIKPCSVKINNVAKFLAYA